jgi:hypothetical protein
MFHIVFCGEKFMDKKTVKRYIAGVFIIIFVPNITFFLLDAYLFYTQQQHLAPISYVVSTIASGWSFSLLLTFDILFSPKATKIEKGLSFFLFLFVAPLIFILTIQGLIPIQMSPEIIARAGFSAVFGFSVSTAYALMKPKKLENSS